MSSDRSAARRARRARRRMRRVLVLALAVIAVLTVLIIWFTRSSPPSAGYDISSPQCSGSYPSSPLFGIVGVNGGLANNANPCLRDELSWARNAPGQNRDPKQPPVSLYLVTANPGGQHVADWPSGGTAPPYGACNGLLTNACSYLYGEQRAVHSYGLAAAVAPTAAVAPWWLDVELGATWAGTYELNIAALKGFIAGLHLAGATGPIGIYSTSAQWKDITGLTAQTTRAAFGRRLPAWVAGAETADLTQARQNCAGGGFTGVAPTLAQYRLGAFDADLRCAATR